MEHKENNMNEKEIKLLKSLTERLIELVKYTDGPLEIAKTIQEILESDVDNGGQT